MSENFEKRVYCVTVFFLLLISLAGRAFGIDSQPFDNMTKYRNALQKLKTSQKESIIAAKEEFYKSFPKNDKYAQDGFRVFTEFYDKIIQESSEQFFSKEKFLHFLSEFYETADGTYSSPLQGFDKMEPERKEIVRKQYAGELEEYTRYAKCGIKISPDGEGGWYLREDFDFLCDILRDYPVDINQYLLFMKKSSKQDVVMDGGLVIPWDELRKRIISFEEFARKYPKLQETKTKIQPELKWLLYIYLAGVDNSPVFDWESEKMNPELKISYETFLKENKNSAWHSSIAQMYQIHQKHQFGRSTEAQDFVNRLNLITH
ncbi:MAG: hypothetical protein AB7S75_21240 [Desulfococcaceae bacterium]